MDASPPSKRTKLNPLASPSPPQDEERAEDTEQDDEGKSLEQEHCTICLQPYLDRTIIPVCAHEFCFECILLWSEQSRKCPLCSRSFDDSYLIHHIRSQYDYQKYYLPPSRTSPPPLIGESRANALRNTRRERQWGRRQRQQREEADQLERAIARRRWIYQHHLYAKHIASNPYTRYRPFPTPAQFAASPDLISRMTIFLRRELQVWPNLDVEFLTTYTISLMKSIDIRSESAVKLISEFLDLDTPYIAGARYINAEHFAHEIYSYLRSPYRDLNVYDQTAQYDIPPEICPPHEIERGSRWSAEPLLAPRSRSRYNRSSISHPENKPAPAIHGRGNSAEIQPTRRQSFDRSARSVSPGREDDLSHYHSHRVGDILRNGHKQTEGKVHPEASSSAILTENLDDDNLPVQPHSRSDKKGKRRATRDTETFVPASCTPKLRALGDDDPAIAPAVDEPNTARTTESPLEKTGDAVADCTDKVGGSSANPQQSRKRPADIQVRPGNRTLSESVQAYLARPTANRHPTQKKSSPSGDKRSREVSAHTTATDARHSLGLRLGGVPAGNSKSPRETTVSHCPSMTDDDGASEQQRPGHRSRLCPFTPVCRHALAAISRHGDPQACAALTGEEAFGPPFTAADRGQPGIAFTPVPSTTSIHVPSADQNANADDQARRGDCACDGQSDAVKPVPPHDTRHGDGATRLVSCEEAETVKPASVSVSESTPCGSNSGCGASASSVSISIEAERSASALEMKLRARARMHVRLKAMKQAGSVSTTGSDSGSGSGSGAVSTSVPVPGSR